MVLLGVLGLIVIGSLYGCAVFTAPGLTQPSQGDVNVEFAGPDRPPKSMVSEIITRTNYFCQAEGFLGVKHVIIGYNAKMQAASVLYLCIGEI